MAEVCKLFNDAGIIVIASFISPFAVDRQRAKDIIGKNDFIEIYLEASVSVCERRDVKGLYEQARLGKVKNFTGVSSPYESPIAPQLKINTDRLSIKESMKLIVDYLKNQSLIVEGDFSERNSHTIPLP